MKREYAALNPYNGKIMEVPEHSLENALKLVKLIPKTKVMTRQVTQYVEWPGERKLTKAESMHIYGEIVSGTGGMKTRLGWPGYWVEGYGLYDDGGMPVHLYPFKVTKDGHGPCDDSDPEYDHDECWCHFEGCTGVEDKFGFPRG